MKTEDLFLATILLASVPRSGNKKKKSGHAKTKKNASRIKKEKAARRARKKSK